MQIPPVNFQHSAWVGRIGRVGVLAVMLWPLSVSGADLLVSWECTGFSGEAQDRCIRTFVELQEEKISKLGKDLEIQQQTVQQLQQQVAQQKSVTAELERKLTRKRSDWYSAPSGDLYPPFGLNLRFGQDRYWGGSPFYGQPHYYGPRFYRHGYRRGYRY